MVEKKILDPLKYQKKNYTKDTLCSLKNAIFAPEFKNLNYPMLWQKTILP